MMFTYDCPDCNETYWSKLDGEHKCVCGTQLVRRVSAPIASPPDPISDSTRRAWNHLTLTLAIGNRVSLDNRDLAWLLEIGAGAVSWHEAQGGTVPEIATTQNPKPKRTKRRMEKK